MGKRASLHKHVLSFTKHIVSPLVLHCLLLCKLIAMVGIFSRFAATKNGGLFSQTSPERKDEVGNARGTAGFQVEHGVEPPEVFMPIEHPMEPLENDRPVRCPQPEPCIIHDGRILKERLQMSIKQRHELSFMPESEAPVVEQQRHIVQAQLTPSSPSMSGGFTKCSPA